MKNLLIVNNSAADYPVPLKFCIDFDHATPDMLQTFRAGTLWKKGDRMCPGNGIHSMAM